MLPLPPTPTTVTTSAPSMGKGPWPSSCPALALTLCFLHDRWSEVEPEGLLWKERSPSSPPSGFWSL